jgi:hypothetical protein
MDILNQGELSTNPYVKESNLTPRDFIVDPYLYAFYVDNMNNELSTYEEGDPTNKLDVLLNIANNKVKMCEKKMETMFRDIQNLMEENSLLRDVNNRLSDRLKTVINGNINKYQSEWKFNK